MKLNSGTATAPSFNADVHSYANYYPFGMPESRRSYTDLSYRYGFNGKEMDNEQKGSANSYDYGFRIYDPRVARFLSEDPLSPKYPWYTPYQFAGNTPIQAIDMDGLEPAPSASQSIPISELTHSDNLLIMIHEPGAMVDMNQMNQDHGQWDYLVAENIDQAAQVLRNEYGGKTCFIRNLVIRSHGDAHDGPDLDNRSGMGTVHNPQSNKSLKYIRSLLTSSADILLTACSIIQFCYDKSGNPSIDKRKITSATQTADNYSQFFVGNSDRNLFMNYSLTGALSVTKVANPAAGPSAHVAPGDSYSFNFGKNLVGQSQSTWAGFMWFSGSSQNNTIIRRAHFYQIQIQPNGSLEKSTLTEIEPSHRPNANYGMPQEEPIW